jgi:hypothetical protein
MENSILPIGLYESEIMNYLKDKSVYLCGGMCAYNDSGTGWRDWITPKIKDQFGSTVYDPTHKVSHCASEVGENKDIFRDLILDENWEELKEVFSPVCRWDLRSVDKSDFLIVAYDPKIHTVGTIHEMVVASWQKKPILLKYDRSDLKSFNPWISVLVPPKHLFADWDELFAYLVKIDYGSIDKNFWTI